MDASPRGESAPIPFTRIPLYAVRFVADLRRLVLLAEYLNAGYPSITRAVQAMDDRGIDRPSLSSFCNVPNKLDPLLRKSFGRSVNLYVNTGTGAAVKGLSADGRVALGFAVAFLHQLDRETAHGM